MQFKYGFIGIGNMGAIILDAVMKKANGNKMCACDSDVQKIQRVTSLGVTAVDAKTAAASSKYLFIGVKPQGLEGLFGEIKDQISEDTVIVSMAAGKEISTIEKLCKDKAKIIRIMPNTAVAVGEGVILYCYNKNVLSILFQAINILLIEGLFSFCCIKIVDAICICFFYLTTYHLHCTVNHLILFCKRFRKNSKCT